MAAPEGVRESIWHVMRAAPLWRGASDETVRSLARTARLADFAKGSIVFSEGTIPNRIGVVIEGHARSTHSGEGRRITVETSWPGDMIGVVPAISELAFETDIEAAEDLTVAFIPVDVLRALIVAAPQVALSVISEISREWASAVNVSKRNSLDVVSRVASYLTELPRTSLGGLAFSVQIPISRVELSALLSTTPETLSRAFHTLQAEKIIESHDRLIIILDGEALMARRNGEPGRSAPNGG